MAPAQGPYPWLLLFLGFPGFRTMSQNKPLYKWFGLRYSVIAMEIKLTYWEKQNVYVYTKCSHQVQKIKKIPLCFIMKSRSRSYFIITSRAIWDLQEEETVTVGQMQDKDNQSKSEMKFTNILWSLNYSTTVLIHSYDKYLLSTIMY